MTYNDGNYVWSYKLGIRLEYTQDSIDYLEDEEDKFNTMKEMEREE